MLQDPHSRHRPGAATGCRESHLIFASSSLPWPQATRNSHSSRTTRKPLKTNDGDRSYPERPGASKTHISLRAFKPRDSTLRIKVSPDFEKLGDAYGEHGSAKGAGGTLSAPPPRIAGECEAAIMVERPYRWLVEPTFPPHD
jgi:hypothetical protein